MYCQNRIVHTVQEGDSLYRLARQYDTTVTELILGNPGVNPYNMQIGMRLFVCPGEGYTAPGNQTPGNQMPGNQMPGMGNQNPGIGNQMPGMGNQNPGMGNQMPGNQMPGMGNQTPGNQMPGNQMPGMGNQTPGMGNQMPGNQMPGMGNQTPGNQMPGNQVPETVEETLDEMQNSVANMREAMRLAWLSMLYWARMYMMSVDAEAKDQQPVEERFMEAADEITDVFARVLPIQTVRQLRNLFMEHAELTGELMRVVKSGNMENYDSLIKEWYANANEIATLMADQNPYFGGRELRNMLLNYLDMTREAIEHQMNGEYDQSIDTFRDMKDAVLKLADYLARGLLAR